MLPAVLEQDMGGWSSIHIEHLLAVAVHEALLLTLQFDSRILEGLRLQIHLLAFAVILDVIQAIFLEIGHLIHPIEAQSKEDHGEEDGPQPFQRLGVHRGAQVLPYDALGVDSFFQVWVALLNEFPLLEDRLHAADVLGQAPRYLGDFVPLQRPLLSFHGPEGDVGILDAWLLVLLVAVV